MKKVVTFLLILLLIGCQKETNDIEKFKSDYEQYNDSNIVVDISLDNKVKYVDIDELLDVFKNKTGIVYFGIVKDPTSRNIIEPLFNVAKSNNLYIYYYDLTKLSDENTDKFSEVMSIIYQFLDENEAGSKILKAPDVYFIKNGEIISNYIGTIPTHEKEYEPLTDSEKDQLKNIYQELIEKS